jgi:hypothetical protein
MGVNRIGLTFVSTQNIGGLWLVGFLASKEIFLQAKTFQHWDEPASR